MLNEIGRLCVKTAGRDANKKCVIVDIIDNNFVLIDGETRRRKCNIIHLEPLNQIIEIKKGASHSAVVEVFKKLDIDIISTKPKKTAQRPKRLRKIKTPEEITPAKEAKPKKTEKTKKPKKEPAKILKK